MKNQELIEALNRMNETLSLTQIAIKAESNRKNPFGPWLPSPYPSPYDPYPMPIKAFPWIEFLQLLIPIIKFVIALLKENSGEDGNP